jgi:hypothetical protein
MASAVRSDAGGSVIGFAIVFVSLVFRGFIPAPPWVWFVVLVVGVLLAVKDGISGLDVVTLGLAGFMIVGPLISGAYMATTDAPDLDEPIPVPSGYGFELDPRSTNLEHLYRSESMPLGQAQSAAVDVVDHYVDALAAEWTVIDREDRPPDLSMVKLRQGDSSRGIRIFVGVVEPFGRPAFLDLRIQALLCREDLPGLGSGEVSCMTAPISGLVRYPGGEPVVSSPQPSPGPLREPVPLPTMDSSFFRGSRRIRCTRIARRSSASLRRAAGSGSCCATTARRSMTGSSSRRTSETSSSRTPIRRTDSPSRPIGRSGSGRCRVSWSRRSARSPVRTITRATGALPELESLRLRGSAVYKEFAGVGCWDRGQGLTRIAFV